MCYKLMPDSGIYSAVLGCANTLRERTMGVQEMTERCRHMQWNLKKQQEVKQTWVSVMAVVFPMDLGIGFFFP